MVTETSSQSTLQDFSSDALLLLLSVDIPLVVVCVLKVHLSFESDF